MAFDSVPGNEHPIFTLQRKYLVRCLLPADRTPPRARLCRRCKAGACSPACYVTAWILLCTSSRVHSMMSPVPPTAMC